MPGTEVKFGSLVGLVLFFFFAWGGGGMRRIDSFTLEQMKIMHVLYFKKQLLLKSFFNIKQSGKSDEEDPIKENFEYITNTS